MWWGQTWGVQGDAVGADVWGAARWAVLSHGRGTQRKLRHPGQATQELSPFWVHGERHHNASHKPHLGLKWPGTDGSSLSGWEDSSAGDKHQHCSSQDLQQHKDRARARQLPKRANLYQSTARASDNNPFFWPQFRAETCVLPSPKAFCTRLVEVQGNLRGHGVSGTVGTGQALPSPRVHS